MNGYFDCNATTRLCDEASEAWREIEENFWHNPSGLYPEAAAANRRLEDAREQLADLIGCEEPERVIFTSGATESNNAVFSHFARREVGSGVIVGSAEHPSVAEAARIHFGDSLSEVLSSPDGTYSVEHLDELLKVGDISIVSCLAANNETGVIQPISELGETCRAAGTYFHCDAAQWIGKLPADELASCDLITGSAHKFRGPKGTGFLVLPSDSSLQLQAGGPQEFGRRAGTENLAGIVSMVAALEATISSSNGVAKEVAAGRNAFEKVVKSAIPDLIVVGENTDRLWNTSMVIVPDHGNLRWITRLGRSGIAASTGSACSAGKGKPSLALRSMGYDYEQMGRALRFSAGWDTTSDDWSGLAHTLIQVWEQLSSGKRGGGLLDPRRR